MNNERRLTPQEAVLADYDVPAVRMARNTDAAAVCSLLELAGFRGSSETVEKRITDLHDNSYFHIFVAELSGRVVGVLTLQIVPYLNVESSGGFVISLVVHKGQRRQGVGMVMLRTAESFARARGCIGMRVLSYNSRRGGHDFLSRLGYEIDSDRTSFYKNLG
jgi:GNAT superfamily N-acetyltransferase